MTGNKLTHDSVKVHRGIDMVGDYKNALYYRRPIKMQGNMFETTKDKKPEGKGGKAEAAGKGKK